MIFGYNGRDGVITDKNGLYYMRSRYYTPDMRRFVNADIIPGQISNAITLNRFAYANGNPVSFVDPFGLSVSKFAVMSCYDDGGGGSPQNSAPNYTQAILVSNRDMNNGGLPVVGHTQLYLYNKTEGTWNFTEYAGSLKTIIDNTQATVRWHEDCTPSLTDWDSNDKIDYALYYERISYYERIAYHYDVLSLSPNLDS